MEINIEKPLRLCLDVVEVDEHVPSIRMQVMVEVQQFEHRLEYRGNVWFDCSVWNRFLTGLNNIDERGTELIDMAGHFTLWLGAESGRTTILWRMKKKDTTGAIATADFRASIDEDAFAHVKSQFMQFERWW
jgi:hypothetical protein